MDDFCELSKFQRLNIISDKIKKLLFSVEADLSASVFQCEFLYTYPILQTDARRNLKNY